MPVEVLFGNTERKAIVQDAFQIFGIEVFFVYITRTEEGSRRELFGVAHDDGALGARERTNGFAGGKLRRLVEDDDVEQVGFRLEILCHGDRAHKNAGRKAGKERGDLRDQFLDRHAAHVAL